MQTYASKDGPVEVHQGNVLNHMSPYKFNSFFFLVLAGGWFYPWTHWNAGISNESNYGVHHSFVM